MIALFGILFFTMNIVGCLNESLPNVVVHETDPKDIYCFYKGSFQEAKTAFTGVDILPNDNKTFTEDITRRIAIFKESSLLLNDCIFSKNTFFIIQSAFLSEKSIQKIMPHSFSTQDLTDKAYSEFLKKLFLTIELNSLITKVKLQKIDTVNTIDKPNKDISKNMLGYKSKSDIITFEHLRIKFDEEKKHSNALATRLNSQMREIADLREEVRKMALQCQKLAEKDKEPDKQW